MKNHITKKTSILSFLVMTILTSSPQSAFADADRGTNSTSVMLKLSALVGEVISIRISPKGDYSNLDLTATSIDLPVATVYESSNSYTGYLLKARSENGSRIRNINSSVSVPYSLKYGGASGVSLSQEDKVIREETTGGIINTSGKEVSISFTGVPANNLVSGLYNDIITFTIESR